MERLSSTIKRVVGIPLVALALLASFGGCDWQKQKGSGDVLEDLRKRAQDIGGAVTPYTDKMGSTAREEIAKLFKIEYQLIEIDSSLSSEAIGGKLAALGQDRWDCSTMQIQNGNLRLLCKRLPLSYLKLIPYLF